MLTLSDGWHGHDLFAGVEVIVRKFKDLGRVLYSLEVYILKRDVT